MINVQRVLRLHFHLGDQVDSHSDSLHVDKGLILTLTTCKLIREAVKIVQKIRSCRRRIDRISITLVNYHNHHSLLPSGRNLYRSKAILQE
jgi:hypothetical protein